MKKSPAEIFDQFNTTIDHWMVCLDDYSIEQLRHQPIPGTWSLGQLYVHIIDDTQWFVEQIREALVTNENADRDMHDDAKKMLRNDSFPDARIVGAATVTNIRQPHNKAELHTGLNTIKDNVNDLYIRFDFSTSIGKTQHPGLMYFNAIEWLQFAGMHIRHHLRQKQRIHEALSS